jgi:hypothetical protein
VWYLAIFTPITGETLGVYMCFAELCYWVHSCGYGTVEVASQTECLYLLFVLAPVLVVVLDRKSGDMVQVSVYLPRSAYEEIQRLVKEGRYPSASEFIRRAVQVALQEAKIHKDVLLPI